MIVTAGSCERSCEEEVVCGTEVWGAVCGRYAGELLGETVCGSCVWGSCVWGSCVGGAVFHSCLVFLIHSRKCSICYSVACSSECVLEVVLVVQSIQTL